MQKNLFLPLLERLSAAPHRSVASVPYGEWFHLYIRSLRASPPAALSPAAFAALDAALLSSVVSRSWREVTFPPETSTETTESTTATATESTETEKETTKTTAACWWRCGGLPEPHDTRECVTAPFLADPFTGGRCVAAWTNALRHTAEMAPKASSVSSSVSSSSDSSLASRDAGVCVIVPFSVLYELRAAGHARQSALSLQERTARLSALHALRALFELQANIRTETANTTAAAPVRLVVCAPSAEFAAIARSVKKPRGSSPKSAGDAFTLAQLCEDATARAVFLAHGMAPLTLLAPQSQHAALRKFGARAIREHSAAALGGGGAAALHRRAAESCGRLVRRMTAREENLRQAFTP